MNYDDLKIKVRYIVSVLSLTKTFKGLRRTRAYASICFITSTYMPINKQEERMRLALKEIRGVKIVQEQRGGRL